MAHGILPAGGWLDRQPQGPVEIDWSNPIARGLVVALSGSTPADQIIKRRPAQLGGTVSTQHGVALSGTGTASAFLYADSVDQRSAHVTTFALLRRTGTLGSDYAAVGKNFQSNGAPSYVSDALVYNTANGGQNRIEAIQGVPGNIVFTSPYYHSDTTKWHTVAGTFGNGAATLFVDGLRRTSVSSGAIAYGASGDNSFGNNFTGRSTGIEVAVVFRWSRALSDAEIASISANPWQLFRDDTQDLFFFDLGGSGSAILRPSSDVSTGGWTATPSGPLYDAINETTASDTDYITSPDLTTPVIFGLSASAPAGTFNVRVRAARSDAAGQLRVRFLDGSNTDVGGTAWQTLTNTPTTYTLSATTTTATATRARIEVQP